METAAAAALRWKRNRLPQPPPLLLELMSWSEACDWEWWLI